MPPAAGEIAADLDRPRRPDADDGPPDVDDRHTAPRRGDAGDSFTTPPALHSYIGEGQHRPPYYTTRRPDADSTAPALHSYIGEDSAAHTPHRTPPRPPRHTAPPRCG